MFSINNKMKYPIQDKCYVIYNHKDYGPEFGWDEIVIGPNFFNSDFNCLSKRAWFRIQPEKLVGDENKYRIKELEVYLVNFEWKWFV